MKYTDNLQRQTQYFILYIFTETLIVNLIMHQEDVVILMVEITDLFDQV